MYVNHSTNALSLEKCMGLQHGSLQAIDWGNETLLIGASV